MTIKEQVEFFKNQNLKITRKTARDVIKSFFVVFVWYIIMTVWISIIRIWLEAFELCLYYIIWIKEFFKDLISLIIYIIKK